MSEFNMDAWIKQDVHAVELDGGRVATIKPIPAFQLLSHLKLPLSAIMPKGNEAPNAAAAIQARMGEMEMSEMGDFIKAIVMSGTTQPKLIEGDQYSDGELGYELLGESRAMTLFREIMAISNLSTEDVAQASEFRNE